MITAVVMAHSRPPSLQRLLRSIEAQTSTDGVRLVICLDPGAPDQRGVEAVIRDVDWPAERCEVVVANDRLGLVGNFERCGALTRDVGEIVVLEDDLELAPTAFEWARCVLDQYRDDPLVAGASLNSLWFNGFTHCRFEPLPDGSDVFFLAVPWYQGMVFTPEWWRICTTDVGAPVEVHPVYDTFADDEWFPDMARTIAASGRAFVFPRTSQAINHGEAGVHFGSRSSWFQTPLERRWKPQTMRPVAESYARYDHFMELDPSVFSALAGLPQVTVDLTGQRPLPSSGEVLTIRGGADPSRSWGATRRPLEVNVLDDESGVGLDLVEAAAVDRGATGQRRAAELLADHDRHGRPVSLRAEMVRRMKGRR